MYISWVADLHIIHVDLVLSHIGVCGRVGILILLFSGTASHIPVFKYNCTLYFQFKRNRNETGETVEPDDGVESEDALSQTSQQSDLSTVRSSKAQASAKSSRREEASDPSVQLFADTNKFQARILDVVQNMRPSMDTQRQGLMDYTSGVSRKLNKDEWDEFEEQVFPIVRQFAAR